MTQDYDPSVGVLTPTQRQVVELVAEGKSNAEIAGLCFIQPRTVEHHITEVFGRLGLESGHNGNRVLATLWYLRVTGRLE